MNNSAQHSLLDDHPGFSLRRSVRLRERAQSLVLLGALACFWAFALALMLAVWSLNAVEFSH